MKQLRIFGIILAVTIICAVIALHVTKPRDLFLYIQKGDIRALQREIAHGCDLNAVGTMGFTPLTFAVAYSGREPSFREAQRQSNRIEIIHILIKNGANPNLPDKVRNWPPLFYAVSWGKLGIAKALLSNGADPNFRLKSGETPIFYVGTICMADLLIHFGAKSHVKDANGATPAMAILQNQHNKELSEYLNNQAQTKDKQ